MANPSDLRELLGADAEALLAYKAQGFDASTLHLPGPDFVERVLVHTDRTPAVLCNYQRPMGEGVRLLNTIQDVYLDKAITIA